MNMMLRNVTLDDKYISREGSVYTTGIQAVVRVALDRARLDREAGLNTGGFISGYRGSPLAGLDTELFRNHGLLEEYGIHFQPGVNEELAATAVMGSQKFDIVGQGGGFDGVFGIWYGKSPGVDRAGDALRQANASGTHRHGGVLALAGDDHLAKSSVLPMQSEHFFVHVEIPVFNPSDIQDVLDFGLHAFELSRYCGLWAAMICISDTMDASAVVDVNPERLNLLRPKEFEPRIVTELNRGLHLKGRIEHEKLHREIRLPAVHKYVRANNLDGIRFGSENPRFGLIATGKAYRDLRQAIALLGITEDHAKDIGLAIYKVAVSWPIEPSGIREFAKQAEKLMVVEHKRAFIELQLKCNLYASDIEGRIPIWGKTSPDGKEFLRDTHELTAEELVNALLQFLPREVVTQNMRDVADSIAKQGIWANENFEAAPRIAYFCSGCPHSRSVKVPEGARAMPGIGCHAMSETAGFSTDGQIAMGNEGALWVGQAPFSKDKHVFVNLGDGTYFHSGILAIRQALASKVSMTYKILYNDAVAMTGGQSLDGQMTVPQLTRQLEAEGVRRIEIFSENPQNYDGRSDLAPGTKVSHRDRLMSVQEELAEYKGVSVIIYDQTCATEKRRRRKRGTYADPGKRLFINERVCEDCGDCSVQSNCLSIEPVETGFGRKRRINQSNCNMDFSCVNGFCPSFVWVEGAQFQRTEVNAKRIEGLCSELPTVEVAELTDTINLIIAGIGGMGVTTTAAILAMAAHIDGNKSSTLDMTGLAQKGGPVTSYVRFSNREKEIEGPRVPIAELDVLIASDLLVASNMDSLSHLNRERTHIFANSRIAPTAEFVMHQSLSYDSERIRRTLEKAGKYSAFEDAAGMAETLLGDAIYTNLILIGMASQSGVLPISLNALENAIRLNGIAVESNLNAFRIGRILVGSPEAVEKLMPPRKPVERMPLEERITHLHNELVEYQSVTYANGFLSIVDRVRESDPQKHSDTESLTGKIAENLFKVMAYKDEYEIARLYSSPEFKAQLQYQFSDFDRLKVMLAPPILSRIDATTGSQRKREFGPWVFGFFGVLQKFKFLRGKWFDPFARTAERKAEMALVKQYQSDVDTILGHLGKVPYELLLELADLPSTINGYGPVKAANIEKADRERDRILKEIRNSTKQEVNEMLVAAE